jgi:predicted nucleic acid-binding protein
LILVDTSVWIDHLRNGDDALIKLLVDGRVLTHPFILGEIALGSLSQRKSILDGLGNLPQATVAREAEVLKYIEATKLFGFGVGYVDAHLLASVRLTSGGLLWTRDRRLEAVAVKVAVPHYAIS